MLRKACLDKFVSIKTCSDITFSGRRQDYLIHIQSDVFELQWVVLFRIHQKAGPLQAYLEHKKAKAFTLSWAVTPQSNCQTSQLILGRSVVKLLCRLYTENWNIIFLL